MGQYVDECPRGGNPGVMVTEGQLKKFADKIGSRAIDAVIPIPVRFLVHPEDCSQDHSDLPDTIYWETNKGSHGWCCSECGMVLQWG